MKEKNIAILVMALLVGGCASSTHVRDALYYPQALADIKSVLVVPFENLTPFPEAGLIVADLMAEEFRAWQGYEIRDRHHVG